MIVEQNASSHGFRTCPYLAPRRRQDPVAANELALRGVPPIVGFAAPAQPTDLYQIRSFAPARLAGRFLLQGAIGAVDWIVRRVGVATIDPYDPGSGVS